MKGSRSAHYHPALRPFVLFAIVLALVVSGSGLAFAVQTSDTAEMDLTILPVENTAVPVEEGTSSSDTESTAPPHEGDQPFAGFAGSGSIAARFDVAVLGASSPGDWLPFETAIVVSDTRGTARGWEVVLSATTTQAGWAPVLMRNHGDTILRIAPVGAASMVRESAPLNGRSLGLLHDPTPILRANPGSGDGVFLQQLIIFYPALAEREAGTMYVCLPFGP